MIPDPRFHRIVAAQTYPLLFATISGAYLYGFPSPESDYDLRVAHLSERELQAAHEDSQLPEAPSDETRNALDDLLLRERLRGR